MTPAARSLLLFSRRGGLDPDALAYAAAATISGATISGSQRAALSAFVAGEKQAGRWSLIKALYLPVWAVANANRINLVSLATGTWSGTPTHSSGFVKGNGTNAYFTSELTPASAGFTTASGGAFFLLKTAPSGTGFAGHVGPSTSITEKVQCYHNGNTMDAFVISGNAAIGRWTNVRAAQVGIFFLDRYATNDFDFYRRNSAGFSTVAGSVLIDPGTVPTAPFSFMAQGAIIPSDGEYGLFGVTLGMSAADAEAFTLSLKTLWEALSGLVLP
jgi:hypothetical protein